MVKAFHLSVGSSFQAPVESPVGNILRIVLKYSLDSKSIIVALSAAG